MLAFQAELDKLAAVGKSDKLTPLAGNQRIKSPTSHTSVPGTANAKRTAIVAAGEGHPLLTEEAVDPRLPGSISLRVAPLPLRQLEVALHVPCHHGAIGQCPGRSTLESKVPCSSSIVGKLILRMVKQPDGLSAIRK